MRYFLDNLFTLRAQNLIPEALWLGVALYFLLLLACFHSVLYFGKLRTIGKLAWGIIVLLPFVGPLTYACYRLKISDSTVKELWHSRDSKTQ